MLEHSPGSLHGRRGAPSGCGCEWAANRSKILGAEAPQGVSPELRQPSCSPGARTATACESSSICNFRRSQLTVTGFELRRPAPTAPVYLPSNDLRVHVGLDDAVSAGVEIRWPSGQVDLHEKLSAGNFCLAVGADRSRRTKGPWTRSGCDSCLPSENRKGACSAALQAPWNRQIAVVIRSRRAARTGSSAGCCIAGTPVRTIRRSSCCSARKRPSG